MTRDIGAFLRDAAKDDAGDENPVYRPDNQAIIEGTSQSGRMIRSFLALGFNQGEAGRRVFDGAFPHVAGGLMPLNLRFGEPIQRLGRADRPRLSGLRFPVQLRAPVRPADAPLRRALLDRCSATQTCPKIFHVATALEMWEGRQSLGLTDPLGRADAPIRANVRTYIMASTQHGPGADFRCRDAAVRQLPAAAQSRTRRSGRLRALMRALIAWVRDGRKPPPARAAPRNADGTLVPPDQVRFPPNSRESLWRRRPPGDLDRARVYNTLHSWILARCSAPRD